MTSTLHSRRSFLAAATATAATLAGCSGTRYSDRYSPGERVSLTVSAPPADDDRAATTLGRQLTDRLSAVGVDATFAPKAQSQLYLDALINHDFDVFVGRHPHLGHPDALYPLLHSSFAPESGWQNPFGVASPELDQTLEALRAGDSENELGDVLDAYAQRVPFTVVAAPEFLTARRADRPAEAGTTTERPLAVLGQLAAADLDRPLRAGIFSAALTENRNPIAGEFRWNRQLLGLLYDPLARPAWDGESLLPWAAESWRFDGDDLLVTLRSDQRFHDGTPVTATDVAFTMEFLSDTSMGEASSPVPATRFRGRTSLVASATELNRDTVRLSLKRGLDEGSAERVLSLPILPASEWRDKSELVDDRVTRALVWENRQPVGSGPLAFESAVERESVTLTPYEDHFLTDVDAVNLARYAPALETEGIVARYAPSGEDAIEALEAGRLDTSLHQFPLHAFDGVADAEGVESVTAPSTELCIVGYNTRRAPLSDFHFRTVLSRLHDREHAASSVFEGFATATDMPVVAQWDVESIDEDDHSLGPFPGSGGELDVERARELFREAGYTYDDDGNLYR
ncbi:ABC transporter substrate-binding protein [Halobacterium sp. R2-5]|uniref:ABC transporter substrate-binding protein n=1 Tax=Halobacterium sp. R2-5 TaxID=2715751 RepID=UPI001420023F|nr:ABC transporter substrate-binding protein [Halobacterium sp. R2-5]NIB99809.1 hypothetical protein [Halobacterium sp. R2-5]